MKLTERIARKSLELQLEQQRLSSLWHRHPLSRFRYRGFAVSVMVLGLALLARNPTCRQLYLAYSLVTKPPFN